MKKEIFKITFTAIMLSLSVVFSSFLQIRLIGDIRLDLSYMIITVICYLYGGLVGGFFAAGVALLNSMFFTSYGVSISWITANLIIGFISGTVMSLFKKDKNDRKYIRIILEIASIIVSCALGLLVAKTAIECHLYDIPLAVKIPKNAIAFVSDCVLMIAGYVILIPIYNRLSHKENGNGR